MNGRKAKALRRAVGFHPAEPRSYKLDRGIEKTSTALEKLMNLAGLRGRQAVGTVCTTGARSQYQAIKRIPQLHTHVLRHG